MADGCSGDMLNSNQRSLRVDDFQFHSESDKQWAARRQFIIKHVAEYEAKNKIDHLLSLSMVWANHVFMGCRYGSELMQKVLEMAEGIIVGERPNFQLVAGESKKRSGSCHDGEKISKKIPRVSLRPRFEPVRFVTSSAVEAKENENQSTAGASVVTPAHSAAIASASPQNTAAFVFDPWASSAEGEARIPGTAEQQPEGEARIPGTAEQQPEGEARIPGAAEQQPEGEARIPGAAEQQPEGEARIPGAAEQQPEGEARIPGAAEQQHEVRQRSSVGTEAPAIKQFKPASVKKGRRKSQRRGLGFTDQEAAHAAYNVLSVPPSSSGPKSISPDTLNKGQQFITRLSSAIAVTLGNPEHRSTSYFNSVLNRSLEAVNSSLQCTYISLRDLSPGELPLGLKMPGDGFACELQCQSVCIGTGYAGTKKAARKRASERAVKLLQMPVEVRAVRRRLGYEMVACSRDDRQLVTPLRDPDDKSAPSGGVQEEWGRWSNFVVVEKAQEAINILSNSADLNGITLDYRFEQLPADGLWRCRVCLDGEPVAQAKGRSKKAAKHAAAEGALGRLRQSKAAREEQWKREQRQQQEQRMQYGSTNPHLKELVILENASNAVGVINNTAQFNRVPVNYELTQLPNQQWKCEVFLAGRLVAGAVGPRKSVKQMAAEVALGSLRQTHAVVRRRPLRKDKEDTISREQIAGRWDAAAAPPPIKDDNIGKRLLRKMGWTGGGLGREGKGIAEPIHVKEQTEREGLGLESQRPAHKLHTRDLEAVIQRYSTSEQSDDLCFSAELDNAERKKIHQLCHKYDLRSKSYGRGARRFLIVSRKMQAEQFIGQLLKEGQAGQYELVKPQA